MYHKMTLTSYCLIDIETINIYLFFRLQGEAAAAEELDYETFLAQVKDQSELSFFERQPIGVKFNRKVHGPIRA
jgi:hypothetical protein